MAIDQEWICSSPECRAKAVLTYDPAGTPPKCRCGAAMKKRYNEPRLRSLPAEKVEFARELFLFSVSGES